ncbi:NAD(P)-binding protein [Hypoxylon fuscum]|nr:NAD(P)-binding protein [Hypoxylon fuscum]
MEAPEPKPYNLPTDAVWFITGCSSGIGQSLVQHLIQEYPSQRVVATARNAASLRAPAIPDTPHVLKLALDVTSTASIDAAFAAALARFRRVDVVVNNAGYSLMGDAEASPAGNAGARALFDTNFWGVVDVTKRALAVLRDVNGASGGQRGGVVVNVSSMGGVLASPGSAYYHASKFALEGFAASVAKELLPAWGIHVVNVEPGGVRTNYATTSLQTMETRHPAYAGGATGAMLDFMADTARHAAFAPADSVARGICEVVGSGRRIPIRVALGTDAYGLISQEVDKMKANLEAWREVSCAMGDPELAHVTKLVG